MGSPGRAGGAEQPPGRFTQRGRLLGRRAERELVDDTDIVRKALEFALKKMGHEAESTSNALLALEIARAHLPDLALLDYRMPGMDGVTLFGELRATLGERCPKVPFVSATPPEEVMAKMTADTRAAG